MGRTGRPRAVARVPRLRDLATDPGPPHDVIDQTGIVGDDGQVADAALVDCVDQAVGNAAKA